FMGVPIKIGRKGVEKVFELKLNAAEKAALENSANAVKSLIKDVKLS
ncbi:MAG: malate dehydrogenase, partial [Calditrichaeota bacterium]|nr:malate dehydrogenase [Calditrichota bacterium]